MMINLTREEAQQVLDALEGNTTNPLADPEQALIEDAAIELLRAKLSEYPENFIDALKFHTAMQELEPEPVAWLNKTKHGTWSADALKCEGDEPSEPLYTTPPQREWQGLTEDELSKTIDDVIGFNSCVGWEKDFARVIEAKLKEKNT